MRFSLRLQVCSNEYRDLPLNYQYELSSAIYKILSTSDQSYATWLHENGYQGSREKKFKLFSFSRLIINKWKILQGTDRLRILSDEVEWVLSFLPTKSTERFVQGVFLHKKFSIGDKQSKVYFFIKDIICVPPPVFKQEMFFETMSPITLRCWHEEFGQSEYISPLDYRAKAAILSGLLARYEAIYKKGYSGNMEYEYTVLSKPKSTLIKIKAGTPHQTFVRGYMCRFKINIAQPLMEILYESGVGELCSQGFGFVKEINPQSYRIGGEFD